MARKKRRRSAVDITDRMIGSDADLRRAVDEEVANLRVAMLIAKARERAGLTQKELAELIGTTQSAIARLESADYEGHSLSTLVRIAVALDNRLEIRLVPRKGRRSA